MINRVWKEGVGRILAAAEQGQTLVEYALILVTIAIGVVGAMTFLRGAIDALFTRIGNNPFLG